MIRTKQLLLVAAVWLAVTSSAFATVQTKSIEYKDGDVALEGYLAWDDARTGKLPGVLVVHEWWGLNDYAKGRARELAAMGYVAFALDMYGKGVVAKTPAEAGELAGKFRGADRSLMRRRATAGLEVLLRQDYVDPARVAAIGYCFGGTTVLELARSGAAIAGVVSFHGGIDTPDPADAKRIKAKVLVLSGAADRSVTPEQIKIFTDSMNAAGVDWAMTSYGGAVHGFTNPANGNDPSKGVAYDAKADRRSWQAMKDFFAEIFAEKKTE